MNPWSVRSRWCGHVGSASALAVAFLVPCAALAQEAGAEAPKGLAAWSGPLLISFLALLVLFLALLAWEFLDRRSGQEVDEPSGGMSPYQPPTGLAQAVDEDDPFQALLKKSAPPREEPMATPFRSDSLSDVPAAPATGYVPPTSYAAGPPQAPSAPPAPSRPARDEEEDELSPFQRLAQIGSEDRDNFAPPAPPAPAPQPARIELSATPPPASARPEAAGGDWASLLNKVQSDEPSAPAAPAAPAPPAAAKAPPVAPAPPKAAVEEEDPWKKLLGQASAGETPQAPAARPAPVAEGEADPWQALLRKTSGEVPAAPPAPAAPAAPPAPQPPPRIKLGTDQEAAPVVEPPGEPGRPRAISLDFKREAGRNIPPPPQTEDEESR